jgi:hypothetical protein
VGPPVVDHLTPRSPTHTCACATHATHTRTHVHTRTHTHTHVHARTHSRTHIYTRTRTFTQTTRSPPAFFHSKRPTQDIAKMIKIADKSGKGGVCFADMEELMLD